MSESWLWQTDFTKPWREAPRRGSDLDIFRVLQEKKNPHCMSVAHLLGSQMWQASGEVWGVSWQ